MQSCRLNSSPQQRFVICQKTVVVSGVLWLTDHICMEYKYREGSGSLHTWINMAQVPWPSNTTHPLFVIKLYELDSLDTNILEKFQLERWLVLSFSLIPLYEVWNSTTDNLTALSLLDLLWESKSHEYSPDDSNGVFARPWNKLHSYLSLIIL